MRPIIYRGREYPSNWPEIRQSIRERSGDHCEWCGVPNGVIGYRDEIGNFVILYQSPDQVGLEADAWVEDGIKLIRIVLTVAHLGTAQADGSPGDKHDTFDVRPENLAHLCQRCHLNFDRDDHIANAAQTRRRKKIERGQLEFNTAV